MYYIVLIHSAGYKVLAQTKEGLAAAREVAKLCRRPSSVVIVRDGVTGRRYSFAELMAS